MDNSAMLSVGDTIHLRFGKDRICYAGMPSEKKEYIQKSLLE